MELHPADAPRPDIAKLPYFNGFPYLATRFASAVYHIRLLPAEWSRCARRARTASRSASRATPTAASTSVPTRAARRLPGSLAPASGREGTLDDLLRLRDPQPNGLPAGLSRCEHCGEWRGECLDTQPRPTPWLVRVHCRCENRNRCAGCGELLAERKLNGNEYDEGTGRILHTGGVAALVHACPPI